MKTIAVISFTNLARDPRVNRQLRFLKGDYKVIAVGTGSPEMEGVHFISIPIVKESLGKKLYRRLNLLSHRYEASYWHRPEIKACFERLQNLDADIYIANDIDTLPVVLKSAKGKKVIYDAHEYASREFEENWRFRLFFQNYYTYLSKRYIPKAAIMTTVCQGLADEFEKEIKIKPYIITNAPDYEELEPKPLKKDQKIKLIHHGIATAPRKIEAMIDMMMLVDERFTLDLMLVPSDQSYFDSLVNRAQKLSSIKFRTPVAMKDLAKLCNTYDLGVYLLEPVNFNHKYALPNKFFEFIQGRLGVAIGPSIEMRKLVDAYDLGVVAEDFSPQAVAEKLNNLSYVEINQFKQNAHHAAHELSSQQNKAKLLTLVNNVLAA